ncbi:unnamed protein product [Symbiodinium sp. CCMP2592]|nr:unnamed protein product [Symbiodinium sp. CCMP2592]
MATFRFIHVGTGLPLHVDGLGDKLASIRYGDCRDDFSLFSVEPAGEKTVYIQDTATGMPLHINGLGDRLASVRCGDCRDDYSKFCLEAAPAFPDIVIRNVATASLLHVDANRDRLASARYPEKCRDENTSFHVEVSFAVQPCLLVHGSTLQHLRVDGLGDRLVKGLRGDGDDYSQYRLESDQAGGFFLVNQGSGHPLHVDGLGDQLLSVRYGDCRDDFARFAIWGSSDVIGSFHLICTATGRSFDLQEDGHFASAKRESDVASTFFLPLLRASSGSAQRPNPKGAQIPAGYETRYRFGTSFWKTSSLAYFK